MRSKRQLGLWAPFKMGACFPEMHPLQTSAVLDASVGRRGSAGIAAIANAQAQLHSLNACGDSYRDGKRGFSDGKRSGRCGQMHTQWPPILDFQL
jgi:hypothetical protein